MNNGQNGKGDTRRPLSVDQETFSNNWERAFGKNETCEYSGLRSVASYEESAPLDETYQAMLKSGMFWEYFPHLSGNWEIDKEHWAANMLSNEAHHTIYSNKGEAERN